MWIAGERVALRSVKPDDFPKIIAWSLDEEVNRYLEGDYPRNLSECQKWYEKGRNSRHTLRFAILVGGELIGDAELDHIAWRRGEAELRVRIGEKDRWDRGFGTDAVRTLLRYAFQRLRLSRVYLRVFQANKRAIRCYEKCGFKPEGRLVRRDARGQLQEILLMAVRAADFEAHHGRRSVRDTAAV